MCSGAHVQLPPCGHLYLENACVRCLTIAYLLITTIKLKKSMETIRLYSIYSTLVLSILLQNIFIWYVPYTVLQFYIFDENTKMKIH